MLKRDRHSRVIEIVRRQAISSQQELAVMLRASGIRVAQSTVSRDIRDLGLVKHQGRYHVAGEITDRLSADQLRRAFQQFVHARGIAGNILVLKTAPGNAHSLGVVLDRASWPEILGTVAGDDTVLAVLRRAGLGRRILRRIEDLLR